MGSAFKENAEGDDEGLSTGELDFDSALADFVFVLVAEAEAEVVGVLAHPESRSELVSSNPAAPKVLRTLLWFPCFISPVY